MHEKEKNQELYQKQNRLIHLARAQLGLELDDVRTLAERLFLKGPSISSLSPRERYELIDMLNFSGADVFNPYVPPANDPDIPPGKQMLKKMEHLFQDVGMYNRKAQASFSKRVCGQFWPRTRRQANKIIEALKSMKARGWKRKEESDNEETKCE